MSKPKKKKSNRPPASIVWFEIPADNIARAKSFYTKLFGWKIKKFPGPMKMPYWHIDTGGADASPDGGMMERQSAEERITNFVMVPSAEAVAKAQKLGGKIIMPKSVVPHMGYFAVCRDTENNVFAVWERNETAA